MAKWGRRGIARLLGALLPARRGFVSVSRRRGPVRTGGGRFVPGARPAAAKRPAAGGRFVPGARPAAAKRPVAGGRFVPGVRLAVTKRPAAGGRFVPGARPAAAKRPVAGGRFVAQSRRSLFGRPAGIKRRGRPADTTIHPRPPGRTGRRIGGKRLVLLIFLSFIAFAVFTFVYVERNLRPPLMHVATMRVKQIVTRAINEAIINHVASQADAERLVEWQKSEDGRVTGFMLNYAEHMRITSRTVETVQRTLHEIKHVPEHIPIGQAIGSAVIASFGPRMPVRFEPVGAAKVELGTRQRDAGINMILVEVFIRITAEMAIIIPFDTKPETVVTEIPISYLLVVGDVPMYYYDNKGNPTGSSAGHAPDIALTLPPPDKETSGAAPEETESAVPEEL